MNSLRKYIALVVAALLVIQQASAAVAVYDGFLSDRFCLDLVNAPDGANMISTPEEHSVHCALLSTCKKSGFAVYTTDGSKYTSIHNLTARGNAMAVAFLQSLPDNRKNLRVRIYGTVDPATKLLEPNDLAIWDIGLSTSTTHTFTGYMTDRLCLNRITGLDGANMMTEPEMHSAKCLVYSPCIASGMALLLKKRPNATGGIDPGYGAIYNLTAAGNDKVVAWGQSLPGSTNNLYVTFQGTVDANGVVDIAASSAVDFVAGTTPAPGAASYVQVSVCLWLIVLATAFVTGL